MYNRLYEVGKKQGEYRQNLSKEKAKSGWSKFWNGDNSAYIASNISNLNNEEKKLMEKMPEIENTLAKLSEQFKGVCKIFYAGQELK